MGDVVVSLRRENGPLRALESNVDAAGRRKVDVDAVAVGKRVDTARIATGSVGGLASSRESWKGMRGIVACRVQDAEARSLAGRG